MFTTHMLYQHRVIPGYLARNKRYSIMMNCVHLFLVFDWLILLIDQRIYRDTFDTFDSSFVKFERFKLEASLTLLVEIRDSKAKKIARRR